MKKRMAAIAVNAALMFVAACGDTGPTGPSPLPGPTTGTPPTTTTPTTTPGGGNDVPQVAGTYRGEGTVDHVPVPGGGLGPSAIADGACTEVEQEGTTVTFDFPVASYALRGTITANGTVEDMEILRENRELHNTTIKFTGESLTVDKSESITGTGGRFLLKLDVQREAPGAPRCDRAVRGARPGNQT